MNIENEGSEPVFPRTESERYKTIRDFFKKKTGLRDIYRKIIPATGAK
jgi:hypothetical protein